MPAPPYDLLDTFLSPFRTTIGEALRTFFAATEPPPGRILELLHALDQAKHDDTSRGKQNLHDTPNEDRPVSKKRRARAKELGKTFSEKERVEKIPDGYIVRNANGEALVYVYPRSIESEVLGAKMLTAEEAIRIAIRIAKLRDG
jgi:hypothetical protein